MLAHTQVIMLNAVRLVQAFYERRLGCFVAAPAWQAHKPKAGRSSRNGGVEIDLITIHFEG
jgi:hypothetical protein